MSESTGEILTPDQQLQKILQRSWEIDELIGINFGVMAADSKIDLTASISSLEAEKLALNQKIADSPQLTEALMKVINPGVSNNILESPETIRQTPAKTSEKI